MSAPSQKKRGAFNSAPEFPSIRATEYLVPPGLQAPWQRWQRRAATFIAEFWLTGNHKHLDAFVRHVVGMRKFHARGGAQ